MLRNQLRHRNRSGWPLITRVLGGVGLAGLAVASATVWNARYRAPYRPVHERITLTLPPGHERLAGMTIGFVTDTHICQTFRPADLERGLALVSDAHPDLLLLGGDYISETTRYADLAAPPLGALARTIPLGAYAVLGNHDHGGHTNAVRDALRVEGITVLFNEAVAIPYGGDELWVAGIDDALLGTPNLDQTFSGIPPGAAVIALWHESDPAVKVRPYGPFAQLSGHSHGGQMRIFGLGELAVPTGGRRFPIGHYDIDGMQLYVSRGLGAYRPPMRLNCDPEVTLITLVAPTGHET